MHTKLFLDVENKGTEVMDNSYHNLSVQLASALKQFPILETSWSSVVQNTAYTEELALAVYRQLRADENSDMWLYSSVEQHTAGSYGMHIYTGETD